MGEDRNQTNQENKILKSLFYQKRTKKKIKDRIIRGNLLKQKKKQKKKRNQRKRKNTMKE